ncbi:MAG: hypothetical protein IAG10_14065, partial [Planctomycetaceae bacterium]|nr:hypothetical protein [Planctomycetaceae bacterium]
QAYDSFSGANAQMMNTMVGWTGLSIFQIENHSPLYGNTQAFQNGQVVGVFWGTANNLVLMYYGCANLPSTLNTLATSFGSLIAMTNNGIQIVMAGGALLESAAAVAANAGMIVSGALGTFPVLTRTIDEMMSYAQGKFDNFKGRDALRRHNDEVRSLVRKYKLSEADQRRLHDEITREHLSRAEIEDLIRQLFPDRVP